MEHECALVSTSPFICWDCNDQLPVWVRCAYTISGYDGVAPVVRSLALWRARFELGDKTDPELWKELKAILPDGPKTRGDAVGIVNVVLTDFLNKIPEEGSPSEAT